MWINRFSEEHIISILTEHEAGMTTIHRNKL